MKRTFVFSMLLLVAVLALASGAQADQITVAGSTSSTVPVGITFGSASFNGTTTAGFAGFSNLGAYTLSSNPGVYNNNTLSLQLVFSLPTGIAGGATTSFMANLFGTVNTLANGGVNIIFSSPTQSFSFANGLGGTGSFSFTVNSVSLNPGGTTALSGFVSGGTFSVPEPSSALLLGAGLLFTPLLGLKRAK